jgi:hypothetical protein
MEIEPEAQECIEIFEHFLDELPFDEAVTAVQGLRAYQQEAQKELFEVMGWEHYLQDDV